MRLTLAVVLLSVAVLVGASLDRVLLKLRVGKEIARVEVYVQRHPENRWLDVSANVVDETEAVVWDTRSTRQLDGDAAPVLNTYEFHLPKRSPFDEGGQRTLQVRASVICASAEARSYVP